MRIIKTVFEFSPKTGQTVNIDFVDGWCLYRSGSWDDAPRATYCTISVREENGTIKNYHDGAICNPKDEFDRRTGMFIAFRKALRQRWEDVHQRKPEKVWKSYQKMWSHFLADMIDDKVDDGCSDKI